ncbi:TetR/AcrR family transcriptional regulator [Phytoactinopolyspora mesophila]|uniref:TetR family transcriptional regulator n=1 Tax=Phytoactinopolyspora mesophila TaxID=2650750 RepID=A0A7K3LYB3_9ACTN|nr:TetR/AcrR family transcriptional regulator [Phytoactinopolyspora mesophila]NDL56031.1 TetR family transcriptional regulator [Phytoactinopolyspora mesophila]
MKPARPPLTPLTPRAAQIVDVGRLILEEQGPGSLTMRTIAQRLGIRAPSLYKHLPDKQALEAALIERGLAEMGDTLYDALETAEEDGTDRGAIRRISALLAAYRDHARAHPNMYRLGTAGRLPRERLAPGLEEWAGTPFFLAVGDPYRAQALWSFAHGLVILELDARLPADSDVSRTWAEGAAAFAVSSVSSPPRAEHRDGAR